MVFNLFVAVLVSGNAFAFDGTPWAQSGTSSETVPREIQNVGIDEKLSSTLDTSIRFKDETGQDVALSQYFDGKRPVLLNLVYFECPMLCNLHLNGVLEVFKKSDWKVGQRFQMVTVSIDSKETPDLATKKKQNYLEKLGQPEAASGWHFLTGTQENIQKLADAVGFRFKWDAATKQWAHSAAMIALTPDARISRYLYGIHFEEKDLKLGLLEASEGKIGNVIDRLLMFCFQYDPNRKTYAFYAYNAMKFGGAFSLGLILAFLIPTWMRMRRET